MYEITKYKKKGLVMAIKNSSYILTYTNADYYNNKQLPVSWI